MLLEYTLRLRRFTDRWHVTQWSAVALAGVLCLSTTATGLAAGFLLTVFCFRGDFQKLRWHWRAPLVLAIAAFLALFPLAALWSDAPFSSVVDHTMHYVKLLFIPLLALVLARGTWPERALAAAFMSLLVLLAVSLLHFSWPQAPFWPDKEMVLGVPFRTYFLMNLGCIVAAHGLLLFAVPRFSTEPRWALCAAALAFLLICHLLFVTPSRTGVLVLLAMIALFMWQVWGRKGLAVGAVAAMALGSILYSASPHIGERFDAVRTEIRQSLEDGEVTSSGVRFELWETGLEMVLQRPLFGHGTGSLVHLYEAASHESTLGAAIVTDDPHNQFLAVAIPFGILGLAGLIAVWGSQLLVFSGRGTYALLGQAVVLQCVVSSMFNSPLFNFELGWFNAVLVGILVAAVWRDEHRGAAAVHSRP